MSVLWTARELAAAVGAPCGFAAEGISIDSRSIAPGDLFVALETESGDGHRFVAQALAQGAAGCLVHKDVPGVDGQRLLRVGDTLAGLGALGRYARARFTGRVVAVTGSVGKTTTKEMLRRALSGQGATHAAVASFNNHWGVPVTLARMPADAAFAVIEIGMNHAGEIAPLSRMARPHVGVITTIGTAHVGNLGSVAAIAAEKGSIAEGLEPGGVMVIPAGAAHRDVLERAAGPARVRLFGAGGEAALLSAEADAAGTDVSAEVAGVAVALRLAAPGLHMAENALAALLTCDSLGVAPQAAAAALSGFAPVDGRGAQRRVSVPGGSAILLDESYNASTVAVRAALAVLKLIPARRRVAVLGDMLEMGAAGPAEHLSLAGDIARSADLVFACGPLQGGLFAALPAGLRGAHAADSDTLAPLVAAALRDGDAVLVKGSLGMKMKTIVQAIETVTLAAESR